jgi:hypothetical protein
MIFLTGSLEIALFSELNHTNLRAFKNEKQEKSAVALHMLKKRL